MSRYDELVAAAQARAAANKGEAAAISHLLNILANAGGALPAADLIKNYGISKEVLAAATEDPSDKDKRVKKKAKMEEVSGQIVIWLTATGWQSTGKSRGVEIIPSGMTLAHALGPTRLQEWLGRLRPELVDLGVDVSVFWGSACNEFSKRLIALAWARIQGGGFVDHGGRVGALTGGLFPDAIIIERWESDASPFFERCWGEKDASALDTAEVLLGVEIQMAEIAVEPMRHKVDAWDTALSLNAAKGVVWIATRKVADVLISLGVGSEDRPGQLLVTTQDVGLGGKPYRTNIKPWWVCRITPREEFTISTDGGSEVS
jgi:hypothetical protein